MEVKRENRRPLRPKSRLSVSILVLMEVKREPHRPAHPRSARFGFNPCFDGSEARVGISLQSRGSPPRVSILVLMEVKREKVAISGLYKRIQVSILVLMEVKRERMQVLLRG